MTFNKKLAIALAAATLVAPLAAQAQSSTMNWNGFYAGINAGGLWESPSAAIGMNNTGGGFSGSGSGFVGGAQAGYNYMFGPVLLGGEIDFQGSTLTSTVTGGAGASNIVGHGSMPWFSTFRARVGYPVGSVMPYVTGGAVWGQQTLSGFDPSAGGNFSASNNFWTYVVGVGMEGRIAQAWTAKLEYLWIGTPDTALSSPASTSINERSISNVVRVGLNYHF
jgi:outer membrane immunogenic protein